MAASHITRKQRRRTKSGSNVDEFTDTEQIRKPIQLDLDEAFKLRQQFVQTGQR